MACACSRRHAPRSEKPGAATTVAASGTKNTGPLRASLDLSASWGKGKCAMRPVTH